MTSLRSHPNHLHLTGAFHELKNIAANRSRCYRGYLLDEKFQPADDKRIAQLLGVDIKQAKQILKGLADVGLIEYITLPEFDTSIDENTTSSNEKSRKPSPTKKRLKRKPPRKRSTVAKKRKPRPSSPQSAPGRNAARSLYIKDKDKDKKKTASGKKKIIKRKKKSALIKSMPPVEAKGKRKPQLKYVKGKGKKKTATIPPTTLPIMSKVVEAGRLSGLNKPDKSTRSIDDKLEKFYDLAAKEFAATIYRELQTPYLPNTHEYKREMGNFASAWSEAQRSGLKPSELESLWIKSVKEARGLGVKRELYKFRSSAEAVWRHIFGLRLAKIKRVRSETG